MKDDRLNIAKMVDEAYDNSVSKGFWKEQEIYDRTGTKLKDLSSETIASKLMLIVSECAEALEEARVSPMNVLSYEEQKCWMCGHESGGCLIGVPCSVCNDEGIVRKPVGFASEIADILIRCGDLCGRMGIDLETAVREKMAFNATRKHKHGKTI